MRDIFYPFTYFYYIILEEEKNERELQGGKFNANNKMKF